MQWSLFEIVTGSLLAIVGAALRIMWARTDFLLKKTNENETGIAVLSAEKTNIFHRLEKIDEKLDRLLDK